MKFYTIYIFLFLSLHCVGQQNYWVKFHNQDSLRYKYSELTEVSYSEWLGMYVFSLDEKEVYTLSLDSNVVEIQAVRTLISMNNVEIDSTLDLIYSFTLSQIHADNLYTNRLMGRNVKIGIVDAGYSNANLDESLSHIFNNERIYGTKDFRDFNEPDFYSKNFFGDYHGTNVFKRIAGIEQNEILGSATEAMFYLAISENNSNENQMEEYAWVEAMEWFYNNDVRLVNSSLGYADRFDDKSDNYTISQMDGESTIISRAAKIAVQDKGMIIVNSMGNEGNRNWKYVVAPADVEGVISVGASKKNGLKADYSSIGLASVNFVKPDVICFAKGGTSYSAPYITGLIAQLLSFDSTLSASDVKTCLEESSHLYPYKNNYVGFGIPNGEKALKILMNENIEYDTLSVLVKHGYKLALHSKLENVSLYHKVNKSEVINQIYVDFKLNSHREIKLKKGNILYLRRPNKKVKYTTIDLNGKVIEVNWK